MDSSNGNGNSDEGTGLSNEELGDNKMNPEQDSKLGLEYMSQEYIDFYYNNIANNGANNGDSKASVKYSISFFENNKKENEVLTRSVSRVEAQTENSIYDNISKGLVKKKIDDFNSYNATLNSSNIPKSEPLTIERSEPSKVPTELSVFMGKVGSVAQIGTLKKTSEEISDTIISHTEDPELLTSVIYQRYNYNNLLICYLTCLEKRDLTSDSNFTENKELNSKIYADKLDNWQEILAVLKGEVELDFNSIEDEDVINTLNYSYKISNNDSNAAKVNISNNTNTISISAGSIEKNESPVKGDFLCQCYAKRHTFNSGKILRIGDIFGEGTNFNENKDIGVHFLEQLQTAYIYQKINASKKFEYTYANEDFGKLLNSINNIGSKEDFIEEVNKCFKTEVNKYFEKLKKEYTSKDVALGEDELDALYNRFTKLNSCVAEHSPFSNPCIREPSLSVSDSNAPSLSVSDSNARSLSVSGSHVPSPNDPAHSLSNNKVREGRSKSAPTRLP